MYETNAGCPRNAKYAFMQSKACYQRYGFNKVLQIKEISPIWDAMRSCFYKLKPQLKKKCAN